MCAKYYENPTMLSRVIAKNVGDVFFETQCILLLVTLQYKIHCREFVYWQNVRVCVCVFGIWDHGAL